MLTILVGCSDSFGASGGESGTAGQSGAASSAGNSAAGGRGGSAGGGNGGSGGAAAGAGGDTSQAIAQCAKTASYLRSKHFDDCTKLADRVEQNCLSLPDGLVKCLGTTCDTGLCGSP